MTTQDPKLQQDVSAYLQKHAETPQENIRNALLLLTDHGTGVSEPDIFAARDLLWLAVRKLEAK